MLANPTPAPRAENDITVAKLVGIGTQDLAAVTTLLAKKKRRERPVGPIGTF
jgi:ornithine cyclodeaminase/alanine dehydrogenase-like protein (mu-crystallin family)